MTFEKLILLIGYRGSGKTSVGKLLADRLGWAWCDSDDAIEEAAGETVADIFADQGEPHFRELETAAIERLIATADQRGQVISLGGGAPMRETNRLCWKDRASCVYLRGDAQTLYGRIIGDSASGSRRPDLTDDGGLAEVQTMLARRSDTYERSADFIVDVDDRTPEAVTDKIVEYYARLQRAQSE